MGLVVTSHHQFDLGWDIHQHKPIGLLHWQATRSNQTAAIPAVEELTRRIVAGEVTRADEIDLIDQALAFQADPQHQWTGAWGDLIERAAAAGIATPAQVATYVEQGLNLIMPPSRTVLEGDHHDFEVHGFVERLGSNQSYQITVQLESVTLGEDDVDVASAVFRRWTTPNQNNFALTRPLRWRVGSRSRSPVTYHISTTVQHVNPQGATLWGERELHGELEILSHEKLLTMLVDDAQRLDHLKDAIAIRKPQYVEYESEKLFRFTIEAENLLLPVAFDVITLYDGNLKQQHRLHLPMESSTRRTFDLPIERFVPNQPLTVVLRPVGADDDSLDITFRSMVAGRK
ncbi:MAG: hypothetical protein EA377_07340 [Phycisphaerales bacterium]|nr:MAG: hypothetical protein EA377_07340 [Phycisphaerales bacterium]